MHFITVFIYASLGNFSGRIVWGALDDVVMGGVSESTFHIDPTGNEDGGPTGLFKGIIKFTFTHSWGNVLRKYAM